MKKLKDVSLSLIVYFAAGFYLIVLICSLFGAIFDINYDFYSAPVNWCCCILFLLFLFWGRRISKYFPCRGKISVCRSRIGWEYVVSVIVLLVEAFVAYNTFFYTGWDCAIIQGASENVAKGWSFSNFSGYFSRSTNNILVVYIYGAIRRLVKAIGFLEKDHGVFALIVMQCFVNVVTGLLIFKTLQKATNSKKYAWWGYLIYFVILGTSPWILITYSDSTMLFLPILMIWLWMVQDASSKPYVKVMVFAVLGVLAGIGYNMKPQAVICFIAVLGIELLKVLGDKKVLSGIKIGVGMLLFIIAFMYIKQKTYYSDESLNKDLTLTPYHFVMMGLNTKSDGTFIEEDVDFTASFVTKDEQVAANQEEILRRVNEMGATGLLRHFGRKMVVTYGDGSFGWPNKNDETLYFYVQMRENTQFPKIKAALEHLLWEDGVPNSVFRWIKQFFYMGVLLMISVGAIFLSRKKSMLISLLYLNLLGVFLFEMIFEASSRHIYIYVPIMIVVAVLNLRSKEEWTLRKSDS